MALAKSLPMFPIGKTASCVTSLHKCNEDERLKILLDKMRAFRDGG